jgi:hypothetical protein
LKAKETESSIIHKIQEIGAKDDRKERKNVATPLWSSVGVKPNTWKK